MVEVEEMIRHPGSGKKYSSFFELMGDLEGGVQED